MFKVKVKADSSLSRSKTGSSLFGAGQKEGEWNARARWYRRGSDVVMMGFRRGYSSLAGGEEEEDRGMWRKEWWTIFVVGVGSISDLYFPVGNFCELELRTASPPAGHRNGMFPEEEEEGTELIEL
jgi:hypothetical protein